MQYLPCSFNQEMVTDGREKRRKPDMWSPQERNEFIDVFLANGRDFKAVLERVKTKNKEQVRQFYYRSLEKVNKLLRPFQYVIRDKSCAEAILALKCYWTLERRCDRSPKNVAGFADELFRLIMENKVETQAPAAVVASSAVFQTGSFTSTQQRSGAPVPAYLVIRPPPLMPSLAAPQFAPSPSPTASPPRASLSSFSTANSNAFIPLHQHSTSAPTSASASVSAVPPALLLPSIQTALPSLPTLASYLSQEYQMQPQMMPNGGFGSFSLKRQSAPDVFHTQIAPLKRVRNANSPSGSRSPSPTPQQQASLITAAFVSAPTTAASTGSSAAAKAGHAFNSPGINGSNKRAGPEEETSRLQTAAEVLSGLLRRGSNSGLVA